MQDAANDEQPVQLPCATDGPMVALAFKLEENKYGQLTYLRIYSGTVRKGEQIVNINSGKRVKVRLHAHLASIGPSSMPLSFGAALASSSCLCSMLAPLGQFSMHMQAATL